MQVYVIIHLFIKWHKSKKWGFAENAKNIFMLEKIFFFFKFKIALNLNQNFTIQIKNNLFLYEWCYNQLTEDSSQIVDC